jgi:hypothetical protein
VAQRVKDDRAVVRHRQSGPIDGPREGALNITMVARASAAAAEDESLRGIEAKLKQRLACNRGEIDCGRLPLRWPELPFAAEAVPDVQLACAEVHALPLEAEDLAEPQRLVEGDEDDRCQPWEAGAVGEQAPLFVGAEDAPPRFRALGPLPVLDRLARIDAERAQLDGVVEDHGERGEDLPPCA